MEILWLIVAFVASVLNFTVLVLGLEYIRRATLMTHKTSTSVLMSILLILPIVLMWTGALL